jgi:16S rRNA (guanine966-N2)-methyltransferase
VRIIAGKWAGRDLASPGGRVRPTAEPVREECMRLVGDVSGMRVADLYAGTGALGLEAMSRGAKRADFVESNPEALHALKANIAKFRARDKTRIFKRDVLPFLEGVEPPGYDVAFADPPYQSKQATRVAERWLAEPFSTLLLVEHSTLLELPPGGRAHRFGDTTLTLYRARGT